MKSLEWDLLAYLSGNANKIETTQEILNSRYFLDAKAKIVYEAMISLSDNELGVTLSLLNEKCKKRLPEVNWYQEFGKLDEFAHVDIKYMAKKIKNKWKMKRYQELQESLDELLERETVADNVTKVIEDELDKIALEVGTDQKSGEIKDILSRAISEYDRRAKIKGLIGLDTGYQKLNKMLHGMMRGCTTIIAARPSMGKTAMMINLMLNMSEKGFVGANFSLEMKDSALCFRMLSVKGAIDYERLQNAELCDEEVAHMIKTADYMSKMPIHAYDDMYRFDDIVRRMRKLKRTQGLDYVIIDYLQLIDMEDGRNKHEEIGKVSKRLHQLSQELDISIIVLAQLNRNVEGRNDKRPMLSDLGDSGSIERDADTVMFLHNEYYYSRDPADEPYTELIVAKNRFGRTGIIDLWFDRGTQKFMETERKKEG